MLLLLVVVVMLQRHYVMVIMCYAPGPVDSFRPTDQHMMTARKLLAV
jgi:hypothetical protein